MFPEVSRRKVTRFSAFLRMMTAHISLSYRKWVTDMPERIGEAEFKAEVVDSDLPVLADFYSDSCIPCKRISPVLSQLESEYSGKIKIVKINTNFEKSLVQKYSVQAAPTLILFSKGEEISRIRGAVKKEEIVQLISSVL